MSKVASFKIDENEEKMHCLRKFNNKVSHTRSLDIFFFKGSNISGSELFVFYASINNIPAISWQSVFFMMEETGRLMRDNGKFITLLLCY